LAEVLFRLGRAEDALRTIDRAIALDPDDEYLQRQRARFERR
jgi:tetratricopeptide (TPR) repeat protein